ncbi:MAG: hypothetical protein PVH52_07210 [bacterium]
MKRVVAIVCVLVLASVCSVLAGPPLGGVYKSAWGDMLEGRFSESYIGGHQGAVGNTVHALSWDEMALGTNWKVLCTVLETPPVLLEDTVDEDGNGHMKWRTEYMDGKFWLDGAGPWATPPDAFYDGTITYYAHTTVIQFSGGVQVGYNTTAELQGYFDLYGEACIQLTIANAASDGVNGVPPAGYPAMKEGSAGLCYDAQPGMIGDWGTVSSITMIINGCDVGNETSSWGAIKSIYR